MAIPDPCVISFDENKYRAHWNSLKKSGNVQLLKDELKNLQGYLQGISKGQIPDILDNIIIKKKQADILNELLGLDS